VTITARGLVAAVAITLVVAAIGVGAYLVGPPAEQRLRRLDERRVDDLEFIQTQVQRFARERKRLPGSLQEVSTIPDSYLRDPVTGQPYTFRVTGPDTYELCADFDRPSDPDQLRYGQNIGKHGAGHICFPQVEASLRQPRT
jgi:hypothetical protein